MRPTATAQRLSQYGESRSHHHLSKRRTAPVMNHSVISTVNKDLVNIWWCFRNIYNPHQLTPKIYPPDSQKYSFKDMKSRTFLGDL
eukprot:TRINITY_DN11237_c0_g1_i1.p1 TRINITY_DN11237_c0_g1~~TRINITY_DN11237_c0_g1_i1.p1  ORF type:complete len:86 (+),score=3.42 TRINITY_DN11237_c0_g1_i1:68-325(+)